MASKTEELVLVIIETRLGAVYTFPDVERRMLEQCLPKGAGIDSSISTLVLANATGAAISVPTRIIKRVSVKERLWEGPPDSGA